MAMVFGSSKVIDHMDWFVDMNDQVVPKEQEPCFQSPDYLFEQVATTPQSYGASGKFNMQGLSHGEEGNIMNELSTSTIIEAVPPKRTGLLGDLVEQLDGLGAIDGDNEVFLDLQLEKCSPDMNNPYNLQPETSRDGNLEDMVMASQSIRFAHSGGNSEESSSSAMTSITSPSLDSENYNFPLVPKDAFLIQDEASMCKDEMEHLHEERSLEEMVLQDLKLVIRKMTRTSRICFRDALYRLANTSKHNSLCWEEHGEVSMGVPSLSSIHHRYGGMNVMESENNALDRSIASILFNELGCDQGDFLSLASSATSAYEPCNYRTWT